MPIVPKAIDESSNPPDGAPGITYEEAEKLFADLAAQPAHIESADKMDANFLNVSERRPRRFLCRLRKVQRSLHRVAASIP
jgi:hypothetical protein